MMRKAKGMPQQDSFHSESATGHYRIELRSVHVGASASIDVKLASGVCVPGHEYFGEFDAAPIAISHKGELNFGPYDSSRRLVTNLHGARIALGAGIQFKDTNRPELQSRYVVEAAIPRACIVGDEVLRVVAVSLNEQRQMDETDMVRLDAVVHGGALALDHSIRGVWRHEQFVYPFSVGPDGTADFGMLYGEDDREYDTNLVPSFECREGREMRWTSKNDGEEWWFRIRNALKY